ncbi:MAG: DEAD/DEAH box helicase family protein [Fibrobacter sp.]|nr:DEAD/DEAH box helicase family protein [Fibrobacter sp.]
MNNGFEGLHLKHSYTGQGQKILHDFLLPAMNASISYDRVTSFYTIDSLIAISQGIDSLYKHRGKMRLIIGVHSFPEEMLDAIIKQEYLRNQIDEVRREIEEGIALISEELIKRRLATIAWMVDDGLLEIKVASTRGLGIFHPKTLILEDSIGKKIAAVGSPNETRQGLGDNYEQLMVAYSWESKDAVDDQCCFFDSLWNNVNDDVITLDVTNELAELIKSAVGPAYSKNLILFSDKIQGVLKDASKMPANYFVSGEIPSLFQHQERAVIDALSRWPVRVLFSDEVGLGKTFEAAATISFLIKYGNVKRAVILTPKAVLYQWQDELFRKFGIDAWAYDSVNRQYTNTNGNIIKMGNRCPIGSGSPQVMLLSAQFARGNTGKKSIFESQGAILPDLLVLDEAHSARVRIDISGKTKSTRMYDMMALLSKKVPHIILASATPMQKDPLEYHSMLKLLGLPKAWEKSRAYDTSLRLIANENTPDINDAYTAGKLLRSTMSMMKPSLKRLDEQELNVVAGLKNIAQDCDQYDVASYVQKNWPLLKKVFVKMHPAHLLTVRNTRKSLERVGYVFPKRNLIEESIENSDEIRLFYEHVNEYISGFCFSVERVLHPERRLNIGFIRANYQQRVASSLYSCKKSLMRRLEKLSALKKELMSRLGKTDVYFKSFSVEDGVDNLGEDELLAVDGNLMELIADSNASVDFQELAHATDLEITSITPLLNQIEDILIRFGDMKIQRSISVAIDHLKKSDKVLLFSRYTDTVEALISEFKDSVDFRNFPFGVYTGQKSVIFQGENETSCSKDYLKYSLQKGDVKIIFCSDAASEGINLQSARVLINVDVPWTPARLEQRIGRVARLGQIAKEVDIHNVWYPSSIEARMYHRIQRRLEESNIAIGEFPDVVAESIKNAVLDDNIVDNSASELQEIRNSYQTRALEELWSSIELEKTTSNMIREKLISICKASCQGAKYDEENDIWLFTTLDGIQFEITGKDGLPESASYNMLSSMKIDALQENIRLINDIDGRPCALTQKEDFQSYIDYEDIPNLLMNANHIHRISFENYPKMLPNPGSMNLAFAYDGECPRAPYLWIKKEVAYES